MDALIIKIRSYTGFYIYIILILSARKKIQIYIFGFPYLSKLIVTQLISILYMEIKDSQR